MKLASYQFFKYKYVISSVHIFWPIHIKYAPVHYYSVITQYFESFLQSRWLFLDSNIYDKLR